MSKPKIIWLQSITCNGNAHSFFNHPDFFSILSHFELIYHPFIETKYSLEEVFSLKLRCDILIIEGAFSSSFQKYGVNIAEIIIHYANMSEHIITTGTCATFGGVFREADPKTISGFAFSEEEPSLRYERYASKLISLPGCPIHPKWLSFVLMMLAQKREIVVDELHRPKELYAITVHTGCSRNEYFEWKVDSKRFGLKEGCLFYEQGCQGPYTRGSCNKILWNDISSKTIAGTPCFGCTEPNFPQKAMFQTKTNMGIPVKMPLGIPKRAYLTLTGVAKSFKIKRFEERLVEYDK